MSRVSATNRGEAPRGVSQPSQHTMDWPFPAVSGADDNATDSAAASSPCDAIILEGQIMPRPAVLATFLALIPVAASADAALTISFDVEGVTTIRYDCGEDVTLSMSLLSQSDGPIPRGLSNNERETPANCAIEPLLRTEGSLLNILHGKHADTSNSSSSRSV